MWSCPPRPTSTEPGRWRRLSQFRTVLALLSADQVAPGRPSTTFALALRSGEPRDHVARLRVGGLLVVIAGRADPHAFAARGHGPLLDDVRQLVAEQPLPIGGVQIGRVVAHEHVVAGREGERADLAAERRRPRPPAPTPLAAP